jgi:hypothetical protein
MSGFADLVLKVLPLIGLGISLLAVFSCFSAGTFCMIKKLPSEHA